MVEQEQTFHLYLALALERQEFLPVVVEVVDMLLVELELEAQVVEAQVVLEAQVVVVFLQEQQEQQTQVVELVELVQIQRVELVELVDQE
tara:strand:- start:636 stop:905 length:270 start_codon:yes stop_codon:yes gene_type:complete